MAEASASERALKQMDALRLLRKVLEGHARFES
jgi:hypothetical protein